MTNKEIRLVIILGPTASGKSGLAVKLAKKFNGEIVSADSRQIYKGLEIGSGAVTKKQKQNVPHYFLSFKNPKFSFSAEEFKKLAQKRIKKTVKKDKIPFLVGGTGFYIDAVAKNLIFPKTRQDKKLRQELQKKTVAVLFSILKKLDPQRIKIIDKNNPRRLIRAIEIAKQLGKVPKLKSGKQIFNCLYLGIKKDSQKLKKDIEKRFYQWLKSGFLKEVEKLIKSKLPEKRFKEIGLHYWFAYLYLSGFITKKEFEQNSLNSNKQYAKKQMTWFKKNKQIHWISNQKQAEKQIKNFLENNQ
jgi:tRNA dimethylallyltransferase